jgi:hypothetical protein
MEQTEGLKKELFPVAATLDDADHIDSTSLSSGQVRVDGMSVCDHATAAGSAAVAMSRAW